VDVDGDQVDAATLEHDPENRVPVFSGARLRGDHAQSKAMERDDDSGKSHFAPKLESSSTCFVLVRKEFVMCRLFRQWTAVFIVFLSMTSAVLAQGAKDGRSNPTKSHRLLIHVDQNDPAVMNLALNNATNVIEYYRAKGEDVSVDIVAYGPGLHMLRADTSPVQDRIKQLKGMAFPSNVQFSACANTKENMEKKEERSIAVLSDATIVPSGVVQLMEKQEKGWSYIRP